MKDQITKSDYTKIIKGEAEYLLEMSSDTLGTNEAEETLMSARIEKVLKETGGYGRLIEGLVYHDKSLETVLAIIKQSTKSAIITCMLTMKHSSLSQDAMLQHLIDTCTEDEH
jgi:hypothetical protein